MVLDGGDSPGRSSGTTDDTDPAHLSSDLNDSLLCRVAGSNSDANTKQWDAPRIGTVLDGKYRLERLVGRGGMGYVYAARNLVTERLVALKWMLPRADLERNNGRFVQEAIIAGRIRHPNVIDIYDVVSMGEGTYLVMELLEGESLRAALNRGPLPVQQAVDLGIALLSALEEAHGQGVIHRDLKPENVFLCRRPPGQIKVLDFGISVFADEGSPTLGSDFTRTGQFVGTPAYTALERLRDGQPFDHRVDLYSVGVILYEALTGSLPYRAASVSELTYQLVRAKPLPVHALRRDVPAELEEVILRALSRKPEARFESARTFAAALRGTREPRGRWARILRVVGRGGSARRRTIALNLTLAAVAAVTLGAWAAGKNAQDPRPEAPDAVTLPPRSTSVQRVPAPGSAAPPQAQAVVPLDGERETPQGQPFDEQPNPRRKSAPRVRQVAPRAAYAPPPPSATTVPSESGLAKLEVIVFPYGDVWIDGKPFGPSPTKLELPIGRHVISGGRTASESVQSVELSAGESRQVVLSWRAPAEAKRD